MDSPYVPFTAINIVFFKKITKLDTKKHPYLQAGGRRFESDYLHNSKSKNPFWIHSEGVFLVFGVLKNAPKLHQSVTRPYLGGFYGDFLGAFCQWIFLILFAKYWLKFLIRKIWHKYVLAGNSEGKCPLSSLTNVTPSSDWKWSPGLESGTINRMQAGAVFSPNSLHFGFRWKERLTGVSYVRKEGTTFDGIFQLDSGFYDCFYCSFLFWATL